MFPIYADVFPEGSSTKPLVHYGQCVNNTGYFRKYDMGSPEKNIEVYGVPVPPNYKLQGTYSSNHIVIKLASKPSSDITLPTYLYYGNGDTLVMVEDVIKLADALSNVQQLYKVPYEGWTHFDFGTVIPNHDVWNFIRLLYL